MSKIDTIISKEQAIAKITHHRKLLASMGALAESAEASNHYLELIFAIDWLLAHIDEYNQGVKDMAAELRVIAEASSLEYINDIEQKLLEENNG